MLVGITSEYVTQGLAGRELDLLRLVGGHLQGMRPVVRHCSLLTVAPVAKHNEPHIARLQGMSGAEGTGVGGNRGNRRCITSKRPSTAGFRVSGRGSP